MTGSKDFRAVLCLCCLTMFLVIIVPPGFEVALDDSWNFAGPTEHFLETGHPEFNPFNSAAAVLHILWGGMFGIIFGPSFTVFRVSNIIMALLCAITLYFTLKRAGAGEKLAFIGAAVFAANPVMMVVSYTYQSDIVFLFLAFLATLFFLKYIESHNHAHLLVASLIGALSIWSKLHGVLIGIGALVYFLIDRKEAGIRRARWITLIVPTAFSWFLFKSAKTILHPVSTTLDGKTAEFIERLGSVATWGTEGVWRFFFMIVALGIYLLPLLAGWLFVPRKEDDPPIWLHGVIGVVWFVLIGVGWTLLGKGVDGTYPFHSSMLRELPAMPETWFHTLLTWIAWPAGALLGYHLTLAALDAIKNKGAQLLLFALLLPQMLILVPIKLFMDRYFLVLLGLVVLILVKRYAGLKFRFWVAMVLIVFYFFFGAARINQYSQANIAQWEGAARLMSRGVPSLNIDAGYPWTGYHNYLHSRQHPDIDFSRPGDNWYIFELCKSTDVQYLVTYWPPPPEFEIIEMIEYDTWFAEEPGRVYVSGRK